MNFMSETAGRSCGLKTALRLILSKSLCLLIILLGVSLAFAQTDQQRPALLGIAHVAVYQSDLAKGEAFYKDYLGFAEPFSLKRADGTEWLAFIKVNDQQYLELFAGTAQNGGHLSHFALYTSDVTAMRRYLDSRGVEMVDQIHKGQSGDRFFTIKDPDGHFIEILEYQADSLTGRERGKAMPSGRVANHLKHVAVLVGSLGTSITFYRDVLGLVEIGRNTADQNQLSWIRMRVPGGTDYIELTLDRGPQSPGQHKAQNHISFLTDDVQKTAADLRSRAAGNSYSRPIQVQTGNDQTRELNLFDPDGARIQFIEQSVRPGQ